MEWRLYFDYGAVFEQMQGHLSRQRTALPLSRVDLRDQMSKYQYWIPGDHKQRFAGREATSRCWAVNLDHHPMGYQAVTDDVLDRTRAEAGLRWVDPRMGELYLVAFDGSKDDDDRDLP